MAASFSRDPLFEVVLRQLPEQVAAGLRNAGLADPAILESYPCDSYKELVGAGATDGGTWQYGAITGMADIGGMDVGGLSLSSPLFLSLFFPILSRLPSSFLTSAPSPCFRHAQIEKCSYQVIDCFIRGNALRALETEPERESFSGSGRGKICRIMKGRSGIKSRKVAGLHHGGTGGDRVEGSRAGAS